MAHATLTVKVGDLDEVKAAFAELTAQRDSARSKAVTLEGQNAHLVAAVRGFLAFTDGQPHWGHDGDIYKLGVAVDRLAAALAEVLAL